MVFHTDVEGVKKIAVDAARLIRELSQPALDAGMDLRYEYSPESFMGTEMDAAVEICQAVIEAIGATPERKDPQPPHHRGELYAQLLRRRN